MQELIRELLRLLQEWQQRLAQELLQEWQQGLVQELLQELVSDDWWAHRESHASCEWGSSYRRSQSRSRSHRRISSSSSIHRQQLQAHDAVAASYGASVTDTAEPWE